ncbi:MAG: inositol monophosphatase family protein [Opitutales bacterium]
MRLDDEQRLALARQAAERAAGALRPFLNGQAGVLAADGRDIKTRADLAAEAALLEALAGTGPVLAEESGASAGVDLEAGTWVIDPLDGTLNFTRGFPMAAVSVAWWAGGEPRLGVVLDLGSGDCFEGCVGSGARLNGRQIAVSDIQDPGQAILATGFPSGASQDTDVLLPFLRRLQRVKKVRLLGSAALSLAQVAAGRFDLYHEDGIWLWDVAAGLALVRAAGGKIAPLEIRDDWTCNCLASNGHLPLNQLLDS